VHRRIRILVAVAKRVVNAAFGLLALAIVLSVGGVRSPFPPTEITHQDSISLMPPPGIRNRFVSYVIPLQHGQRIRLVGAWREFPSFARYYVVSVPGAGLPAGITITMAVNSDGIPDPGVYEPTEK